MQRHLLLGIATWLLLTATTAHPKLVPLAWVGLSGLWLVVVAGLALYLARFEPALFANRRHLGVLALMVVSGTLLTRLTTSVAPEFNLLPAIAILLSLFLRPTLAVVVCLSWVLVLGLILHLPFSSALLAGAGCLLGALAVHRPQNRLDVAGVGLLLAGVNTVLFLCLEAFSAQGESPLLWAVQGIWALASGVGSAVLAVGLLPYFEGMFGIITPFKLMELANSTQPLLRELMQKAPGTYHHSVVVGNLAEAAAEAIGGDAMLSRVGALYHDIGKTNRPYFFIENQLGGENPHSHLSPRMSAKVIIQHVHEGVEMAKAHRLPAVLTAFIAEHHGDSLVSYFHHQAKQGDEVVREEEFRYPGPRPKTKEAAIVMLADGTEAASRTLAKPTSDQLEALVEKIVRQRLEDHQLSEAPLTLADLERIKQAFTRVLQGLFHTRIDYPEEEVVGSAHT